MRDSSGAVAAATGERGEFEARRAPRMVPGNGSALLAECGSDVVDGRVWRAREVACATVAVAVAGARGLDDMFDAEDKVDGDDLTIVVVE